MIEDTTCDERLAQRRPARRAILPLSALDQLAAGVPILYRNDDDEAVEELPDGSRYVVELVDLGRSPQRLREL